MNSGPALNSLTCHAASALPAHLTFALHHVLADVCGDAAARSVGVDRLGHLVSRHRAAARALGYAMEFRESSIAAATTPAAAARDGGAPLDFAVALHACDTATDDALVAALARGARHIIAAPCCHQELQRALKKAARGGGGGRLPATTAALDGGGDDGGAPPALSLHARDNLILQRLGDTITDQLRAAILRLLGYRVDVVEFVELAHSPKNLLLRAARRADAPPGDVDAALRREYETTKAAWRVTPHLETLLVARCLAVEAAPAAASSLDRELAARVRAAFLEPQGGADIARP